MPDHRERELIFEQLAELPRDHLYEFAKAGGLRKLSQARKDEIVEAIRAATPASASPRIPFSEVANFVARQAELQPQHVRLWQVGSEINDAWNADAAEQIAAAGGDPTVLGRSQDIAAPEGLEVARVALENGVLEVTAAGRRDTRRHNREQEKKLQSELPAGMIAVVWETVSVRVWARFTWSTITGEASLHVGPLGTDAEFGELQDQFQTAVPWLPWGDLEPIDLAAGIAVLHRAAETEQNGGATAEVGIQGLNYLTKGIRSNASSRAARQSMLIDDPAVVDALAAIRDHGVAQLGNCYWRTRDEGGPPAAAILERELHVVIIAADQQRIDIKRPATADELVYVLSRIRALSS